MVNEGSLMDDRCRVASINLLVQASISFLFRDKRGAFLQFSKKM